jgi:Glucose / Sorbosone dehydrogenase
MKNILRVVCLSVLVQCLTISQAAAQLTIELKEYLTMPITGLLDGKGSNDGLLARVNTLREEPGGANRFFITDLNGPIYIVDKETKKLTVYLDFNGREGHNGLFHRLFLEAGYGSGINAFYFDPDYRRNGKFYTVHFEDSSLPGSNLPDNASFPRLNVTGYTLSQIITTPGPMMQFEEVLIEWTDTDISNATFEGTARELMRIKPNNRLHPLGDMIFNPTARPGDPDWRVLYIECGDGGSGEATGSIRSNPQRLDNVVGKILRIIPDLNEHTTTSTVSENGRYRIPNDNPFVSVPGARKEIWAYGFRNPHRLNWAIDPDNPANNHLVVNNVGLHTWEMVQIVRKGANYGYPSREGNELLKTDNTTASLPAVDRLPVQVSDITNETVVPTYPVIQYKHAPGGGDAIGSGFVYNGKAIPSLRGKYLFTDITTGRIWYADYKDMLRADDGKPETQAAIHEVKIRWNNQVYDTMFPIAEATYHARGGKDPNLPGRGTVSGDGRADARFAVDGGGELYLYSKTDGVIRLVVAATQR